ncbi:hypothetical protein [Campylobacter devanensis]|nr:hypothetical protein [Campylobacter sp. P0138]
MLKKRYRKNLLMLSVFDYFNLKNDEIELNKIANEISSVVKKEIYAH